jgi:hypothetical protein
MFFGKKERDLVKQVNDELAERVIGQTIAYYSISLEDSEYHPIYGEAIDKVTLAPVRVYAYVTVENEQTNERYGYEYQTKLTVNFHRKRITEDQNLFVRVGDFVQYGDEFYEIVRTYNDTRYYFGQVQHKFQISAECVKARRGTFRIQGEMVPQIVTNQPAATLVQPLPAPPPATPRAPNNAQYVVLSADDSLTAERVLTAGTGITLTDFGAGGALTIASTAGAAGIFTTVDASNAYTTSSLSVGASSTPTDTLTVGGTVSASSALQVVGATVLGNTLNVSGSATFGAGMTHNRTAVSAATYTILVTDYLLAADSSSNTVTLTLPAAASAGAGKTYVVKDEGGQSAVNAIIIDGDSVETIDGSATFTISSPYGAANLYTNGSNWFVY